MFCHNSKENFDKSDKNSSTYAHSLHSHHYHHTLSKELSQISLEFQHENDRIKTFLTNFPKRDYKK